MAGIIAGTSKPLPTWPCYFQLGFCSTVQLPTSIRITGKNIDRSQGVRLYRVPRSIKSNAIQQEDPPLAEKLPEEEHPVKAFGYAARDTSGFLSPFNFSRRYSWVYSLRAKLHLRATGDDDVRFKVLYCGICHTDLHFLKNDFGNTPYPVVAGHEIVGEVTEVGSKVTKLKVGDKVGVGYIVGSCASCSNCDSGLESYCPKFIQTFASRYKDGTITYGGFSNEMVVSEHFAVKFPENLPLAGGAPLLCAGITVYSPMKYYGLDKPGTKLGIVGLGGLGHVAVKFAKAFGAEVTVISTSLRKKDEAINHLGADSFLVSRNPEEMMAAVSTLDGIIDCVSAPHDVTSLLGLLKTNGKLVMVGLTAKPLELPVFPLILGRKQIGGSYVGGVKETQEMLDFAAKHGIVAEVEVVPMDYINTAMERLEKGDVRYRFVLDVGNTLTTA